MKKHKKIKDEAVNSAPPEMDYSYFSPLQVIVSGNFDRACKNFRAMVQQDKILSIYKEKQGFEKPSDKKRRKHNENIRRIAETEEKQRKILSGEYDREKNKKQTAKNKKMQQNQVNRKIVED